MDDGHRAGAALLAEDEPPTALFCIRHRVAAVAIHAAALAGVRVPEDLSVIGFDDEDLFAEVLTPPLTTIALPHQEMGWRAMTMLLDLVEGAGSHVGAGGGPGGAVDGMADATVDATGDRAADEERARVVVVECPLVERSSVALAPEA